MTYCELNVKHPVAKTLNEVLACTAGIARAYEARFVTCRLSHVVRMIAHW